MKHDNFPPPLPISPEMKFFLFLLEQYAAYEHTTGDKVLREWDERGLTSWIYGNYEMYHCEAVENAFADIDSMLTTGKPAW